MAKADDTSSTFNWIWLRDALALAVEALGSVALAKQLLRKWLAAGNLPWSCTSWKGLDAEGIAWLEQESRVGILSGKILFLIPSTVYHQGDPQFWLASLTIDWEDNLAGENAVEGAKASGVKVSHNHLLALLPEEPREHERVPGAGAWIAAEARRMKMAGEIPPDIGITDFARELESRMGKAAARDGSLRAIKWKSIRNELKAWGLWPVASIK